MLSVRVVTVDYYISKPIKGLDTGNSNEEVRHWTEPVIRIFGPTSTVSESGFFNSAVEIVLRVPFPIYFYPVKDGPVMRWTYVDPRTEDWSFELARGNINNNYRFQNKYGDPHGIKTCIHIHGVYPYMYIPYTGGENPGRDALLLGAALDQALAVSLESKIKNFVYRIVPISGIPLYGYHSKPRQFFKIYFFNPYHIKKASDLLLKGAILGQKFQPHEAHIPFILQFMIDYNIYGMSFINLEKVKYRSSPDFPDSLNGIENSLILPRSVKRNTYCYWEVDALAEDIANIKRSGGVASVNPGLQAIWEDEKSRRRDQNKASQITPEISEIRPEFKPTSNELMHRQRLEQKLRNIVPEAKDEGSEKPLSYPAEVPERSEMLEASVVGVTPPELLSDDLLRDVSDLIDESILTQTAGKGESDSEGEQARIEDDSILGRNQRDEEEAELEDGDGGDMTQPLEMLDNVIGGEYEENREERGKNYRDSEDQFWKEMAEKILQLDGTDDISSMDSDEENRRTYPQLLNKTTEAVDGMLDSGSPSNESVSHWSNNIMSLLNEGSAPQAFYPAQQTFWTNWSPKINENIWPIQNSSESWAWDKNDSALLECLSYSVKKSGKNDLSAEKNYQSQPSVETVTPGESYTLHAPQQGDYFQGNYTPATTMSPLSNVGSFYNISPPSAILTPSSEIDSCSDINLDSISQISNSPSPQEESKATEHCSKTQIIDSKTVTLPRVDIKKPSLMSTRNDLMDALKKISESNQNPEQADNKVKTVTLTLKQYIKSCGEIVSVDFKNLSGKEMIVVEYKPSNSKSNQNKYLIKPLDKFLEDWNSAEVRLNNSCPLENSRGDWPKLINGFSDGGKGAEEEKQLSAILNTLENKYTGNWLDEAKIKSIKNKFVVKSMEMLPDNSEGVPGKVVKSDAEKSYKVNKNVDLNGKIKLRLIKDKKGRALENENESETSNRLSSSRRGTSVDDEMNNTRAVGKKKRNKEDLNKVQSLANCRTHGKEKKNKEEENFPSGNKRLIDQINRSFEDYFKNIVKVNAWSSKNEAVVLEEEEEADEQESTSGEDGNEDLEMDSDSEQKPTETIKFITQLLSALMSLSQSSGVPPLSITINFGRGRVVPSVQFNLQSGRNPSHNRKTSKKLTVNNFDGPADTSSSEESVEGKPTASRKKHRKDLAYRPLNVVVQKTAGSELAERKRKLPRNTEEEPSRSGSPSSNVHSAHSRRRRRRGSPSSESREQKRAGSWSRSDSKQEVETENLTEFGKAPGGREQLPRLDKALMGDESDFIGDSEDESGGGRRKKRKFKKIKEKAKRKKTESLIIPQVDVIGSSDGEGSGPVKTKVMESDEGKLSLPSRETQPEKNVDVSYGEIMVGLEEIKIDLERSKSKPEENFEKMAEPSETFRRHSQESSKSLSGSIFHISPDVSSIFEKSPVEELACNSDDSIERVEKTECERVVTPFELSGPRLNSSADPSIDSQSSGKTLPGEIMQGLESSPSGHSRQSLFLEISSSEGVLTVKGSKTIVPKTGPPTFSQVESTLKDFGFPEASAQVPFYSDPKDLSKCMEIGERMFKIENYSVPSLKPHVSELGLLGTEERRNLALNLEQKGKKSIRSALVGESDVHITPLFKPPSQREVWEWSAKKDEDLELEERKTSKMRMPKSPGEDSGSDDAFELSITPVSDKEDSPMRTGTSAPDFSSSDHSSGSSPGSFPKDIRKTPKLGLGSKKGPLHRIKGIKRLSLLKKLETIAEEQQQLSQKEEIIPSPETEGSRKSDSNSSFGIRGITLDNTYGFRNSVECLQNAKSIQTHENITMLVLELHIRTRGSLYPDPDHDPILAAFYTLVTDGPEGVREKGLIAVGEGSLTGTGLPFVTVNYVPDETALLDKLVEFLRAWDPDILAGFEIEMHSWGYLFQRSFVLKKNLFSLAGRVIDENPKDLSGSDGDEDVPRYIRHMKLTGRIVLDVWRLLRHEVALTSYTFENVMYHILQERHPKYSYQALTQFWEHPTRLFKHVVVEYYLARTEGLTRLLDHLDFISRNSELARLFGIQFYEVLSRGSQFRVESMMLRLAKPLNYVPCSPSIQQRAAMRAPASLPLIMEPESMFYSDPVIVLDFQSLYPSMIIAYNYCFSTCLGRVELLGTREPFEFGCTQLQVSTEEIKELINDINISPAGVAFVNSNVRKGVLPKMLEEILETRLMVKKSMKKNKGNKILGKVLHARQLGLKLIANVTYGYTAANFSGRMPCIEVGDSVVSKGRETLQRAIEMVKNNPKWGARVVYGDTDSLFVLTPGKSRQEAFRIGNEIAESVTRDNPKPVKLKLEKVYQPSILQTKKRYVGYMYETPDQEKPVYDAKGIETVRRDGCPATAKILQKALQILFETKDVSLVKRYTIHQFAKLFQGRINIQDLVFAKEYRGRRGYRPGACVPALELAKRWTQKDKRREPRVKERVPYVIVNGPPGLPLIRLVRSPRDLFRDPNLRINAVYYITKAIIPPMQRCFSLLGADVSSWYSEMPRKYHKIVKSSGKEMAKRSTISQYFSMVECVVCKEVTNDAVCPECRSDVQKTVLFVQEKIRRLERSREGILKICGSCCGRRTSDECESLECPVLYRRHQVAWELEQIPVLREIIEKYLEAGEMNLAH